MEDSQAHESSAVIRNIQRVLENGATAVLATLMSGAPGIGRKMLIEESGQATGSLGQTSLDHAARIRAAVFLETREEARTFDLHGTAGAAAAPGVRVLFERIETEPRVVVCGAGHVGAALAKLASFIGYQVTLIDDRSEFVTRDRFPDSRIELVKADNWTNATRNTIGHGRGVSVAIVTRGHNEDEECLRAVMTTRPDYVGLIGSKRRTNIVLNRLRQAGVEEDALERVRAPIGLDIRAVSPEEVALAILAEIVAERRGGKGGSLSIWRREKAKP